VDSGAGTPATPNRPTDAPVPGSRSAAGAGGLREVAAGVERLAARSTAGNWRTTGLLASRPEVVAVRPDGGTEHVAEVRAASAGWITTFSPAVAAPLAALLRAVADAGDACPPDVRSAAADLADVLVDRTPDR
jgi:hypothetical protein